MFGKCWCSTGGFFASEGGSRHRGFTIVLIFSPPSKIPQFAADTLSAPRCLPLPGNPPLVYEQRRVDLATFRAVPASTWGHCPQVLLFTIVWDTPEKEKVAKWSSAPASILEGFNEIYAVDGPKKPYKTREKRQSCQIDPCLPPYQTPPPWECSIKKTIPPPPAASESPSPSPSRKKQN